MSQKIQKSIKSNDELFKQLSKVKKVNPQQSDHLIDYVSSPSLLVYYFGIPTPTTKKKETPTFQDNNISSIGIPLSLHPPLPSANVFLPSVLC